MVILSYGASTADRIKMRKFLKFNIIITLIAIMILAFPSVSYANDDLLDNTSSGIREYQIFKNNDTTLA